MINLEEIFQKKEEIENEINSKAKKKKKQARERLEKEFQKESAEIQKRASNTERRVFQDYVKKAAKAVLENLEEGNDEMLLTSATQKQRNLAEYYASILRNASTPEAEEIAVKIIEAGDRELLPIFKRIVERSSSTKTIESYISQQGSSETPKGCVILLTPIKEDNGNRLVDNLEKKISGIIDVKRITLGTTTKVDTSTDSVVSGEKYSVEYTPDVNKFGDFLFYSLEVDSTNQGALAKGLEAKLNELQPVGFKEKGLTHKVVPIEPQVLEYLMGQSQPKEEEAQPKEEEAQPKEEEAQPKEEEYISVEEAAKILGYTVRGVRMITSNVLIEGDREKVSVRSLREYIEYKEMKHSEGERIIRSVQTPKYNIKRDEALSRLEEWGVESLDARKVAEVLGMGNTGSAQSIARKYLTVEEQDGRKLLYSAESLRKFIEKSQLSHRGWGPPTE